LYFSFRKNEISVTICTLVTFQNAELRVKLAELQNELQDANERRETAIAIEMSAKQECDTQTRNAAEAQVTQLLYHGSDDGDHDGDHDNNDVIMVMMVMEMIII